MSVSDWVNAEVGYTLIWLSAQIERENDVRSKYLERAKLNRLNTFYIVTAFGAEIDTPSELYPLIGDDDIDRHDDDPFSEDNDKLFDNLTL